MARRELGRLKATVRLPVLEMVVVVQGEMLPIIPTTPAALVK
jgi:hypothetical protein